MSDNPLINSLLNSSTESSGLNTNCSSTSFKSFDDLDITTCEPYITDCDLDYNHVSITNFSKEDVGGIFEYNISYCCTFLGSYAGFCSIYWRANCDLPVSIEGPLTKCVGSSTEFFSSTSFVAIFDSWFYNEKTNYLEYHVNQDLCRNGCLDAHAYTPNFTPVLDRSDTFLCPTPPYTPTPTPTKTPVDVTRYTDVGLTVHDNIRFASDEPISNECCLTAVSEVVKKPNSTDNNYRVFYKLTSDNLFYDQTGALCDFDQTGTLIQDYATDFYISSGDKPSDLRHESNTSFLGLLEQMPNTPTLTLTSVFRNYVSIESSSGLVPPTPTEEASLSIKDKSLLQKTFTFDTRELLESIESSNSVIAELNSDYWLYELPSIIYDTSDLSGIHQDFLPKFIINNSTAVTQDCTFNFSGEGFIENDSSASSFRKNYNSSDRSNSFINLRSMPFDFLTSTNFLKFSKIDPVHSVSNYTHCVFLNLSVSFYFKIEDSVYNSQKDSRLSFCENQILERQENFEIFLKPYPGFNNAAAKISYPNSFGVDVTTLPQHSLKLVKGYSNRIY